jgi:hypothetical protein
MHRRLAVRLLALAPVLAAVGCFTFEPVRQRLELRFAGDGTVLVTAETSIAQERPEEPERRAALERRLERLRSDLLEGQDPIARLVPPESASALRLTHEWRAGELILSSREAELPVAHAPLLFRGSDVDAWIDRGDGWLELHLAPRSPTRATRAQAQAVSAALDRFAAAEWRYVAAMTALHAWLDAHPDRVASCYEAIAGVARDEAAEPEETVAIEAVEGALGELATFFDVEAGQDGLSIDGLSRLVHDPFPADVTLVVPTLLESEGFARGRGHELRVPSTSLLSALQSLEGRWVRPDLAVSALRSAMAGGDIDFGPLVDEPRSIEAPASEAAIAEILRAELRPQGPFRVRWSEEPREE